MINKKSQKKLQEIRESMRWCCINIFSDYCHIWEIKLTEAGSDDHEVSFRSRCHKNLNDAVDEAYNYHKKWKIDGK